VSCNLLNDERLEDCFVQVAKRLVSFEGAEQHFFARALDTDDVNVSVGHGEAGVHTKKKIASLVANIFSRYTAYADFDNAVFSLACGPFLNVGVFQDEIWIVPIV
jgi:hypothetical protein